MSRSKKIIVRTLFVLGFIVAAYVLYAHVAELRTVSDRRHGEPWTAKFDEPKTLASKFTIDTTPDLHVDANVGMVTVGREGGPGTGQATLRSMPIRFDGGLVRARFRVRERASYDVFVGLERDGQPDKRLWFVLRNDPATPSFRIEGAGGMNGPTFKGEAVLDYVSAPDVIREDQEWHTLSLRFESASQQVELAIDDVPVASRLVGWESGFDARVVFGVRDRNAAALAVDFAEIDWDPHAGREPTRLPEFTDEFLGARLDPLRWRALFQNEWRVAGSLGPFETGRGLLLRGQGLQGSAPGVMTPVQICTLPFELTPTRVEVDWELETLSHAALNITLGNLVGSRSVAVDIANVGEGDPRIMIRGQLDESVVPSVFDGPAIPAAKRMRLQLEYDSWLRTLRVLKDDTKVFEHRFGLQRNEFVRVCLGEQVYPEGRAEARVRRFWMHRAPY